MTMTSIVGLCRSFQELRSDLVRQAQWRAGLDKLPTSVCVAILHIDAAPLKDSLMPISQQAIEQVQRHSLAGTASRFNWLGVSLLLWQQGKIDINAMSSA